METEMNCINNHHPFARFEVFTALTMQITVSWRVITCSMVKICQFFEGTWCFYLQGGRNTVQTHATGSSDTGEFLPDCDVIRQKAVTSNTTSQFITAARQGMYPM